MDINDWMFIEEAMVTVEAAVGDTIDLVPASEISEITNWQIEGGSLPPGIEFFAQEGRFFGEVGDSGIYETTLRGSTNGGLEGQYKLRFVCSENPVDEDLPEESPILIEREAEEK